jgi:hypothetical protein
VSKLRIPYHQLKILLEKIILLAKNKGIGIDGVTVEDLNKLNPTLQKSGLKKGDKIRIPEPNQIKT